MKRYTWVLVSTFVIVSFQNCGRIKKEAPSTEANVVSGFTKVSSNNPDRFTIYDHTNYRFFDVDLNTGEAVVFEDMGEVRGEKFCISQGEVGIAKGILSTAEICSPEFDPNALKDKACSMIYTYPYVGLEYGSSEYKLGEMNSGCDIPVDLCGEKKDQLRAWTQMILRYIETYKCQ